MNDEMFVLKPELFQGFSIRFRNGICLVVQFKTTA